MRYTSKLRYNFVLTIPALIFSLVLVILPYVTGLNERFGLKLTYIPLCLVIWVISLILLFLENRYLLFKTHNFLDMKIFNIILGITVLLIAMGSIISVLTGFVIVSSTLPSGSSTVIGNISYVIGYFSGVAIVLPALCYFGIFLYLFNLRRLLGILIAVNTAVIGGGLALVMICQSI